MIKNIVKLALNEDLGSGDVSAALLDNKQVVATIISRESAIFCGADYAQYAFILLDEDINIDWKVKDGDQISPDQILCELTGNSNSIISAERVALNFLQTLSSVATQTQLLVDKISHTKTKLLDTRKTIPGLRQAQKYAVTCGGGVNHRMGLYDCVMLKENHIIASGSMANAISQAREKYPELPLIVEVESLDQLKQALSLKGISRILCDNFSTKDLGLAVGLAGGKIPLEASGNIDIKSIVDVANTGVDYISTGSITKNIQAIDLSLRFA